MAKVMTTPIMAILQFAFYGKKFSRAILTTLAVVCIGVCLATATEIKLTLVGFSVALAACFVTAIYCIVKNNIGLYFS
jgi:solute carrier family 35, member E3